MVFGKADELAYEICTKNIRLTCFLTPGNMTKNATYNVANNRDTATIDTSKVTGVRFENEYKVGPPSSRNASNQPFIMGVVVP